MLFSKAIAETPMKNIDVYIEKALKMAIEYGPKLFLAIIVLVIGLSVVKSITGFLKSTLTKREVDPTLTPFLVNLFSWGAKALLFISVFSMVGVETTSFVAALGAAGLAVGLALQGSLANFAGGVLILMFRPFTKGDYIDAQGFQGTVQTIDIFATIITTIDNKKVVLPNGPLAGGPINNYTSQKFRRVDLSIGISYGDDIKSALKVLKEMCEKHPKVLKDPEVSVVVIEYGDSSINLMVRPWAMSEDYWDVYFDLMKEIKYTLDENNFSIPFPQRDVHLFNQ